MCRRPLAFTLQHAQKWHREVDTDEPKLLNMFYTKYLINLSDYHHCMQKF